jgi:hypothetical protein
LSENHWRERRKKQTEFSWHNWVIYLIKWEIIIIFAEIKRKKTRGVFSYKNNPANNQKVFIDRVQGTNFPPIS